MASVSLIVPCTPTSTPSAQSIGLYRQALESAGHRVEVLAAMPESTDRPGDWSPPEGARIVWSSSPGLAAAAIEGMTQACGEFLVVVDPAMEYPATDVVAVVKQLIEGEAGVVVANRWIRQRGLEAGRKGVVSRGLGLMRSTLRALVGTSDPMSGLVGVARSAMPEPDAFSAVGTKFSFELLAKLEGAVAETPASLPRRSLRAKSSKFHLLSMDELRHLKRLADHRWGNFSRLIQFCVVGASGMFVDLSCYAVFQALFSATGWFTGKTLPFVGGSLGLAVSGALAILIAMSWNFSLNRRLTFSYARTGSLVRQYLTYALSNALGNLLSLTVRLALPRYSAFFNHHKLAAAVVGIVLATGISFSLSRWFVFNKSEGGSSPGEGAPEAVEGGKAPAPNLSEKSFTEKVMAS